MIDPALIRARFAPLSPHLDERGWQLLAASEAQAVGHGGIVAASRATGLAPSAIGRGLREPADGAVLAGGFVRYAKPAVTFSDALAAVRRQLWTAQAFPTSAPNRDMVEIPAALLDRLTQAACYPA